MYSIHTPGFQLTVGAGDSLLVYNLGEGCRAVKGPVFEVDGEDLAPDFEPVALVSEEMLTDQITQSAAGHCPCGSGNLSDPRQASAGGLTNFNPAN